MPAAIATLCTGFLASWLAATFAHAAPPELSAVIIAPEKAGVGEFATSIEPIGEDFLISGYTRTADTHQIDGLLMRTSPSGDVRWRKRFGDHGQGDGRGGAEGGAEDFLWHILPLREGGFLVTGWTGSTPGIAGGTDGWLIRVNDDGETQWQRSFGGMGGEWLTQSLQLEDGYISIGQSDSTGAGQLDFYIVRTDREGRELWSKTHGTAGVDRAFRIAQTSDGGFVVVGMSGSGPPHFDARILRIDANGSEVWMHDLKGRGFDVAHDVKVLEDGSIVVVGYTHKDDAAGTDVFIMRLDADGRERSIKTFGGAGDDRATHGLIQPDGSLVIVGYSMPALSERWDFMLRQVDVDGLERWSQRWGGNDDEMGRDLMARPDGSVVIIGHTLSHGTEERILIITCKLDESNKE